MAVAGGNPPRGPMKTTYWASDGAAYERFLGRWTRVLAAPFTEFARLPEEGAIIDIGCGTGSLALTLTERRRGRVAGLDIAVPYIAFARSRPGTHGVDFAVGDAFRLPYSDRHFTASLAQLALNFVPDPALALREMRRVVRPGGVVAAAVWDFRGGLVYQRLFWDTTAGLDPAARAARDRLFSSPLAVPEGLAQLWRGVGLGAIERGS